MKINRCSVMGKRGFQYNDGTCHIGLSGRHRAEEDAAASGEAFVSFELDRTLIDEEGNATELVKAVHKYHDKGFQIAITTARDTQGSKAVEEILDDIGIASIVKQIHMTSQKAKGLYFRDAGFSPVFHIDDKAVEIAGLPDSVRGIHASQLETPSDSD